MCQLNKKAFSAKGYFESETSSRFLLSGFKDATSINIRVVSLLENKRIITSKNATINNESIGLLLVAMALRIKVSICGNKPLFTILTLFPLIISRDFLKFLRTPTSNSIISKFLNINNKSTITIIIGINGAITKIIPGTINPITKNTSENTNKARANMK